MFIAKTLLHRMWVAILLLLLFSPLNAQQYGWKVIARPTSRNLYAVEFTDALHGVCAGIDTIYRTTDGGATWQRVRGPSNATFTDISFADQLNGWIVGNFAGAAGLIWRTTNGGASWTQQVAPDTRFVLRHWSTAAQNLTGNTTVGVRSAIPDTGILRMTTDGGVSWKQRTLADSIAAINKITFIDSLRGWALGTLRNAEGILLRTRDGGRTWKVYKTPKPFTFVAISFIDSLRGWASSTGIFRTRDGGETWQRQYFDPNGEVGGLAISFIDSLNGWLFGGVFYQGIITEVIHRTSDGGNSWRRESIGLTGDFGYLTDAVMLDPYHGWAVSYDGAVLSYQLLTSVAEKIEQAPKAFALEQNYPNPFNPATTIQYSILKRSPVTLKVYDALGRVINTLIDEIQESGTYRATFDGSSLASGAYFYKLVAGEFTATQVMNLLK